MRKTVTLIIALMTFLIVCEMYNELRGLYKIKEQPRPERVETELNDWQIFIMSLAEVESEYQTQVVNPKVNATGLLQITKVYVKEANRIVGEERFTMADAKDPIKSIEMFHVVNGGHNPKNSIKQAIKLHNPNAGGWYEKRILREMNKYRVREQVRKELITNYNTNKDG